MTALALWRLLVLSQLREQPMRIAVTVTAIALGVALGAAVYLVNGTALNEFGLATKRLVGEADVVVRNPREGFEEGLFVELARDPKVAAASPVLELEVAIPGRRDPLKLLGLDPFRAATLQPMLIADIGNGVFDLFQPDAIYLSAEAAQQLSMRVGDPLSVAVGGDSKALRVTGILSAATYPEALAIMDIASAQWAFAHIGRLNRIDLRLKSGTDAAAFRASLARRLPAGTVAVVPQVELDRAITVTRAYRVNLNMLALVALWTGAFLVFSTQSLSVLRRRRTLGLLRALGATRNELNLALLGEGAALGLVGSCLGIALGMLAANVILRLLAGDLGNGQLHVAHTTLHPGVGSLIAFALIGTLVSSVGAWVPARSAARQAPARALKGGDADYVGAATGGRRAGIVLIALGALLARLPAIAGLPLFGYAAIAALLFGAVLLVPSLTVRILRLTPRLAHVVTNTAIAQLRENVGLVTLSLAAIIVSFSLMVAMAIMVHSFRNSFDQWLGKLLPADLQIREPFGNDTAYWSPKVQAAMKSAEGISRIEFRRTRPVLLDANRPAITLIARGDDPTKVALELPLVQSRSLPPGVRPAWISEALQDLYGYRLGDSIMLPLGGRLRAFTVAGVWRDYARAFGAVAISRPDYIAETGDADANEGSVWLDAHTTPGAGEAALRAAGDATLEILTSTALRERSLKIFDRAFAITYALEAVAVVIGLMGVSFAASSTALARRSEFGMLRHIGMLRRQVIALLATEGILMSLFGVMYGLLLGSALSLVLVYVVNRQSFNWSIDLALPSGELAALAAALIAAAALTALWSGRAATHQNAVRAVREDW